MRSETWGSEDKWSQSQDYEENFKCWGYWDDAMEVCLQISAWKGSQERAKRIFQVPNLVPEMCQELWDWGFEQEHPNSLGQENPSSLSGSRLWTRRKLFPQNKKPFKVFCFFYIRTKSSSNLFKSGVWRPAHHSGKSGHCGFACSRLKFLISSSSFRATHHCRAGFPLQQFKKK